jgi:hypothetical protein
MFWILLGQGERPMEVRIEKLQVNPTEIRAIPIRIQLSAALPEMSSSKNQEDAPFLQKMSKRIQISLGKCLLEKNLFTIDHHIQSIVQRYQYLKLIDYYEGFQD